MTVALRACTRAVRCQVWAAGWSVRQTAVPGAGAVRGTHLLDATNQRTLAWEWTRLTGWLSRRRRARHADKPETAGPGSAVTALATEPVHRRRAQ